MKIRSGFVSNSSSSSFCILGVSVDNDAYEKVYDKKYNKEDKTILDSECSISYEGEHYIGLNPEKIGEDETIGQAKDRIVTEASKLGITIDKKDIDWITDGGYNG
jgi:hypothetical protein